MAVLLSYDTTGIREDLSDIIYNISPTDTPFLSGVGKTKATNTAYSWQTDTLTAVAANAKDEGATISYPTLTSTTKVSNYTQISSKACLVSGTDDASNLAGRNTELAYQVAKSAKELKRDMENALLANVAAAAGTSGSPTRYLGGLPTWYSTNVSAGTGGSGFLEARGNLYQVLSTPGRRAAFCFLRRATNRQRHAASWALPDSGHQGPVSSLSNDAWLLLRAQGGLGHARFAR